MAPLIRLFALFSFFAFVFASPHLPRNAYNHPHRALALPPVQADDHAPLPHLRRQRSLNKRCVPRPSNSTSSAPSSSPTPLNVVPNPIPPTPTPTPTPTPSPSPSPSSSSSSSFSAPSPTTPTTSPTPTPTPSSGGSSYSGTSQPSYLTGTQTGQITWFDDGLGACGIVNNGNQTIAAVSHLMFDSYPGYGGSDPNQNPICGRGIVITYNGKDVAVTVTDRCQDCQLTDLDLSQAAFQVLAVLGVGRLNASWRWQ